MTSIMTATRVASFRACPPLLDARPRRIAHAAVAQTREIPRFEVDRRGPRCRAVGVGPGVERLVR